MNVTTTISQSKYVNIRVKEINEITLTERRTQCCLVASVCSTNLLYERNNNNNSKRIMIILLLQ